MLCHCVLHVLGHFVQWNCCIKAMCSTIRRCVAILAYEYFATQCLQILVEWFCQRWSKGTCSAVLSCDSDCVLQVILGWSHGNCCIMDVIWMLGFARNIVFFHVKITEVRLRRKVGSRASDGLRRRRFAVDSCSFSAGSGTESSRWLFFCVLMLCHCVLHVLHTFVHWKCCIQAICSTDRSSMAASSFLPAAAAGVICLCFAAESRKSYCNACMTVANGALAGYFFHFDTDDFSFTIPLKKCFKIVVFPLWPSRFDFGAANCFMWRGRCT